MAKEKITWEDPVLIDMHSLSAHGASCHSGTLASNCNTGSNASNNCNEGTAAGIRCSIGDYAVNCKFGSGLNATDGRLRDIG